MYSSFARVYDELMRDVDREAWAQYIVELLGGKKPLAIAECACGTGALTIPLRKLGYNITGFDSSEDMLEVAAANARRSGVSIPFILQDMRHLALHKPVDSVIAACDGVNYLSIKGAESFFCKAHAALKEEGLLLFDVSSRYKLSTILGNKTFAEDEGAAAYIWKNIYDSVSKQISMELTLFELEPDGRYTRFTESQVQRAHSVKELTSALTRAGFEDIEAFAAFTFDNVAEDTERIQFRAKKPKGEINNER